MYKIRLYDGTEFHARFCSARNGLLTVGIDTGAEFLTIAEKFGTASQTVTFIYDGTAEQYVGYTKLQAIVNNVDGEYEITLRKE